MQVGSVSGASALQSLQVQQRVDTAVLGKAQDAAQAEAEAAVALLASAAESIGQGHDGASGGHGNHGLDVTA